MTTTERGMSVIMNPFPQKAEALSIGKDRAESTHRKIAALQAKESRMTFEGNRLNRDGPGKGLFTIDDDERWDPPADGRYLRITIRERKLAAFGNLDSSGETS
jgi:hypothetical protein